MQSQGSGYMIETKTILDCLCDAETKILIGLWCRIEESKYWWDFHGFRPPMWTLMIIVKAVTKLMRNRDGNFDNMLK